jgi:hypothetical protein
VRVIHGLEGDTGVIAVEVAVLDKVLDGVDDLEERPLVRALVRRTRRWY